MYVLFMLHYVLSNSKGKYCMNNVIMCMSILVDRGCVHNIIDNYYYLNGNFALIACQENFAIQLSKLHKKSIPSGSAQKSTKNILKQSSSPVIHFLWSEQIFIDNLG